MLRKTNINEQIAEMALNSRFSMENSRGLPVKKSHIFFSLLSIGSVVVG